ncbi:hypothetical protein PC129_g15631 [Phytophthora cactorum]|uniref:Uncharacterized protein n=1 Tax=Phytophthora cactorum TaxID=29920 RepID=A0A329RMX0_9STRA|nr:hypothetical protein Pcac1_g7342 [Phytophthora cactorum]KAG2810018.1 hypothetical protein PC111_g15822 [Phytophthora cactorum]KAG2813326.1 hypothetical protein PC112_g14787 [Phytophthora cactorum]KAG2852509.1 hypothetical protein PC113_g14960 [Phytophthora cactorum]KAG2895339.1 hypothetical protein PC114_g15519 [Phytophthora cactorum]
MQVHQRWLKLALVAVVLVSAIVDSQVYTMRSLDGDTESTSESGTDPDNVRTPTPTARKPTRTWIPITNAPSDSSETEETPRRTPAPPTKTPRSTTKTPRVTTKTPRAQAPAVDSESASRYQGTLDSDGASDLGATEESSVVDSTEESGSEEETDSSGTSTTKKKKKKTVFTKSPYLEQTTPVPNGIHTANDDSNSDASASEPTSEESTSDESGSSSKTTKPKTTKSKTKKKTADSASGSDSESSASSKSSNTTKKGSNSTKKDSNSAKQDSTSETSDATDSTQNSDTTPSPDSSTTSASASGSGSSSAASVMTDSASADKTGMSNTLLLGLMMGGAVALVMLVAVFVYIKTNSKDEEEDDDMDPVLRTARHDGSKGTAQSSTLNANYHDNHNMSPGAYSDDYYDNQHNAQYDQEPYGHHGQNNAYNDPNLDMLTPQSQIALAHSQMSLPPMAQTGHSTGSSQYSDSQYSSFYAQSAYSTDQSVSQVVGKYPGMRQGKGENDVAGSSEEESDFEGDSIQDMSQATNVWKTAGRNRGGTAASGMDRSMVESRFAPSDTRSTAASDYNGKNRFQESEYTEYRMSTGYESSYAGGNNGYDKSFAATKSGYEKSYASDQSGYDSRYADGKSFQSSGFSEYEQAVAPPRNRGDSTNSDASSFYRGKESRFTDASYC